MTSESDELGGVLEGSFSGRLWESDLFARDHPACLEGRPDAWDLTKTVVDHGCFLFKNLGSLRSELGLRDLVVQALFRRVLITGEAIRVLLALGLEEPAFATFRTLLELERDLRLVIGDPSDKRSRRLALFLAVKGRRNFAKATKNQDARDLLKGDSDFFDWFRTKSRSFRQWTKSERFQDVAAELMKADHWHGLASQQEAFEKAGMATGYHVEYGGSSLFVHGGNVEHDFANTFDKEIRFKPLAQRDPAHTLTQLGRLTHSLIVIYRLIWEDRGEPEYQESLAVELRGQCFEMDPLSALWAQAITIFPNPRSQSSP